MAAVRKGGITVADALVRAAKATGTKRLFGLPGGGSSLDVAKGCNFILTNGGRMEDYWGYGKAARPMLPSIAVPTTAGTGSETTGVAIFDLTNMHAKTGIANRRLKPTLGLLDPENTRTMPKAVAAWLKSVFGMG